MTFNIKQLRSDIAGFNGRFEAREANEHESDRLVYIPADNEYADGDPDGECVYSDALDFDLGEPIARMLNAMPSLLAEIDRLRGLLVEACELTDAALSNLADVYPHHDDGMRSNIYYANERLSQLRTAAEGE